MPRRSNVLATNEIYHVYNRSVARQNIFSSKIQLRKAFEIVDFYRMPQAIRLSKFKALPENIKRDYLFTLQNKMPFVAIYAFAFMPNHFHFLLKQLQDNGIARFVANFQNSFAKYFNLKHDRNGALFQNSFKAKRVETDEQFAHVSRYIHLNPVTSYLIEFDDLAQYSWTSFFDYANGLTRPFINTRVLLAMFQSNEDYAQFVSDQVGYQKDLAMIKDLIIE